MCLSVTEQFAIDLEFINWRTNFKPQVIRDYNRCQGRLHSLESMDRGYPCTHVTK